MTPREYKPSTEEQAFLAEIAAGIRALEMQTEGALKLMLRQQKLEGDFKFVGDKLVEQEKES